MSSLRQLAGELDLDSLMTLIADGGRRAVGGDAAVLLLEENGALAVQRASGLSAAAQRALTAWFAGMPASGDGVQLVDDVGDVPVLAPVLAGPPPLTSLCCAPLPGPVGPSGMLVVLSRTSDTFLPQERGLDRGLRGAGRRGAEQRAPVLPAAGDGAPRRADRAGQPARVRPDPGRRGGALHPRAA